MAAKVDSFGGYVKMGESVRFLLIGNKRKWVWVGRWTITVLLTHTNHIRSFHDVPTNDEVDTLQWKSCRQLLVED